MATTDTKPTTGSWEIILLWIGVNVISIFGGILLGAFLNGVLWTSNLPPGVIGPITNPVQRAIIMGFSIGGIKGLLEWIVLQRYEAKWKGWIPASMLAWTIGVTVAEGLPDIRQNSDINVLIGGTIIGLSQWIVLRRYLPNSYWWIIATAIGSFALLSYIPLGYTFLMILESFIAFIIAGLFMGITTGATLSWLLILSWLEEN